MPANGRRVLGAVTAKIAVVANTPALVEASEYLSPKAQRRTPRIWSVLSSLHSVVELPATTKPDVELVIVDTPGDSARLTATPARYTAIGPFSERERTLADRRYTFFGNAGLFTKLVYGALERNHGTLSFHATAMYDARNNHLYVACGGPGAGKTVLLIEGCLRRGYQVFSTEMTHIQPTSDGIVCHKGSLYDNVRLQNLRDFPEARERLPGAGQPEKPGDAKVCLSFAPLQTEADQLVNPRLTWLFPKVEGERSEAIVGDVGPALLRRLLYESAGEMIVRPRLLYEVLAVGPYEYPNAAEHRLRLVQSLLDRAELVQAKQLVTGARNSLAGVD